MKSLVLTLTQEELLLIASCKAMLDNGAWLDHISKLAENSLHLILSALPPIVEEMAAKATDFCLKQATSWAITSMGPQHCPILRKKWHHHAATTVTGAVGGFFGLKCLVAELPISSTILLRSIACIAQREGLDLQDPAIRLQCLSVLSLGGACPEKKQWGYWTTRKAAAAALTQVLEWNGEAAAPKMVAFVTEIGARFGLKLSQKIAVQICPVVGSLTAATLNNLFLYHHEKLAEAHFTIERLCRTYGENAVRKAYAAADRE